MEGKCRNCGAELGATTGTTVTCTYCGSTYPADNAIIIPASPPGNFDQGETQQNTNNPDPQNANKKSSGCGIIFLLMVVIIVVLAEVHKYTGFGTGLLAADSLATDTSKADTLSDGVVVYPGEKAKRHIKKTNPDLSIFIKHARIHTSKEITSIAITYQNKIKPRPYITYIDFSIQLFDKNGKELPIGEGGIKSSRSLETNDKTETEEWYLDKRYPKAKTAKVKLKRVELDEIIWDY